MLSVLKKIKLIIIFIAISIIIFAGVTPSILHNNWSWLERSGSLLTAYGVVLTYLDISGAFTAGIKEAFKESFEQIEIMVNSKFKEASKEINFELSSEFHEENNTDVDNRLKKFTKDIRAIEFSSIFCGTIIWGYGETFPRIFS